MQKVAWSSQLQQVVRNMRNESTSKDLESLLLSEEEKGAVQMVYKGQIKQSIDTDDTSGNWD